MFFRRPVPPVRRPRARERGVPDALQLLPNAAEGPLPVFADARARSHPVDGREPPSRRRREPAQHLRQLAVTLHHATRTVFRHDALPHLLYPVHYAAGVGASVNRHAERDETAGDGVSRGHG